MDDDRRPGGVVPRGTALGVGAAVLLVVALAALADQPAPRPSEPSVVRSWPLLVGTVVGVASAVALGHALWQAVLARREVASEDATARRRRSPLALGLLLLAVLVLVWLLGEPPVDGGAVTAPGGVPPPGTVGGGDGQPDEVLLAPSRWVVVGALVLLLAGGAAALAGRRGAVVPSWREERPERASPSPAGAAALAGLAAIDLSGEPRAAVLAAFDAMEVHLARLGRPRGRAQTQAAFVAELLAADGAPGGPLRVLDTAFHRARFSTHAVTADDVAAVRTALRAVADTTWTSSGKATSRLAADGAPSVRGGAA